MLIRWALTLQDFSFTVFHRAGRLCGNVDALSRYPVSKVKEDVEFLTVDVIQVDNQVSFASELYSKQLLGFGGEDTGYFQRDETGRILVPQSMTRLIIESVHNQSHRGVTKTYSMVRRRFS